MPDRTARHAAGSWLWPLALALAALALYANALHHPFLSDDTALIGENAGVTEPTVVSLGRLWTIGYTQGLSRTGHVISLLEEDPTGTLRTVYRPITTSSYWLNALLTGASPVGFRVGNVLLHALAAWMLGLWTARFVGTPAGMVASALVLVHPLATDVVNKIAGRADILMLLGVAAFLVVQRAAQGSGWTWGRTLVGGVAAWVALGAKETGVIVVPLALVQGLLPPSPTSTRREVTTRHAWRGALALGVPIAAYALARMLVLRWAPYAPAPRWDLLGNPLIGRSLLERLPAIGALTLDYLRLLVIPWPLLGFDPPNVVPARFDAWSALGLVTLATMCASIVALTRRHHPAALAATWFVATFLIVGHVVTPLFAYREARFAYDMLGALAVAIACVASAVRAAPRVLARASVAALVVAVLVGAVAVVVRNRDFTSLQTLLEADLRHRPDSAAAMLRLAGVYEQGGRSRDAEALYRASVAAAPSSAQAKEELGTLLLAHGRRDEATAMLRQAVEIAPSNTALVTLARLALDRDDVPSAAEYLRQAERIAPDDPYVGYNLAVLADKRGDRAGAIRRLEQVLVRNPEFRLARDGLAQIR